MLLVNKISHSEVIAFDVFLELLGERGCDGLKDWNVI